MMSRFFLFGLAAGLIAAPCHLLAADPPAAKKAGGAPVVGSGADMPAVLRDMPRAGAACRRDDPLPAAVATAPFAGRADLGCALSVSDAGAAQSGAETVLADVRPASAYATSHIEASRNLQLTDLHSKPYWRDKRVVLVGSGKGEAELYRECAALKQAGYRNVHVLQGGIAQWVAQGLPLAGRSESAAQLARLSTDEFLLEMRAEANLVVLDPAQAITRTDVPGAQALPVLSAAAIRAAIDRRRKADKNALPAGVVVVARPGTSDEQIGQWQQAAAPVPLLVYAEGRPALVAGQAQQKATWAAQAKGPKRLGCGL
jgi:rhodanese-related sulfurtransferase